MSEWEHQTPKEYEPEIGSHTRFKEDSNTAEGPTYADEGYLRRLLDQLESETKELKDQAEDEMYGLALPVGTHDSRLLESHRKEWPKSLGAPSDSITYRYYKALRLRRSTSAEYIRHRYEEAARGVTGTNALDILQIASIVEDEALLIREFIDVHVGDIDDSSEFRLLELFQDWAEAALVSVREFWAIYQAGETPEEYFSREELDAITPEEARQGQTVFKVKFNSHNNTIRRDIEYLKKNFAEFAPDFYARFLGPAMRYRLNVGRRTLPTGSRIAREIQAVSSEIDERLKHALSDEFRRVDLFRDKVTDIKNDLVERDKHRTFVKQLAVKGTPLPVQGPNVITVGFDSGTEVSYWRAEEEKGINSLSSVPGTFVAAHSLLENLDENDHPQYLLHNGGTITGPIHMNDGTSIDGVRPSTHVHNGCDGTERISGADILDGSLIDDVVDADFNPDPPEGLRLISFRDTPESPLIEATIAWEGSRKYTYEVQVAIAELQSSYANPSGG